MIQYRGEKINAASVAELTDSSNLVDQPAALKRVFDEDGYVFLRNALDRDRVNAARGVVLQKLFEVGEIKSPVYEGQPTGTSRRKDLHDDLGLFWKSVSECQAVRDVTHGSQLSSIAEAVLGTPATGTDYVILRVASPGNGTRLHYDLPFFNRYPGPLTTCWIPFGDLQFGQGTLTVIEESHKFGDLLDDISDVDVYSDPDRSVEIDINPQAVVDARESKFLTADFRAGDVILFSPTLLHGSFDQIASDTGVRLSCDVRYVSNEVTLDDRYFGPNPKGISGGGYGELNGAKPLNEEWHVR